MGVSVQGVSVHGGLCLGVSVRRVSVHGGLCLGVSVRRVSVTETRCRTAICMQYASYWNAFVFYTKTARNENCIVWER